jgi:hypothetical protein
MDEAEYIKEGARTHGDQHDPERVVPIELSAVERFEEGGSTHRCSWSVGAVMESALP